MFFVKIWTEGKLLTKIMLQPNHFFVKASIFCLQTWWLASYSVLLEMLVSANVIHDTNLCQMRFLLAISTPISTPCNVQIKYVKPTFALQLKPRLRQWDITCIWHRQLCQVQVNFAVTIMIVYALVSQRLHDIQYISAIASAINT